jgi:methionine-rich copper-binding protein CopC
MVKQVLLALSVAGMFVASPVLAHAKLKSTSPAAGAQLGVAPKSLTLRFNEDIQLALLKLTSQGKDIPVAIDRGAPAAAEVTVPLPQLTAGTYQVQWSALSPDDGHVVKGMFVFVITGGPS